MGIKSEKNSEKKNRAVISQKIEKSLEKNIIQIVKPLINMIPIVVKIPQIKST